MARAARLLLGVALLPAVTAAQSPPPVPEIVRTVAHDSGHVDVVLDGLPAGAAAKVDVSWLRKPVPAFQVLAPGSDDPYADSPARLTRHFANTQGFARYSVAEAEDGGRVDLYVGLDADGDRLPDPGEEICRSQPASGPAICRFGAESYWVLAHRRDGGTGPVHVRTFDEGVNVPWNDAVEYNVHSTVSAPGRVDDDGTLPVRIGWFQGGMGDGEQRMVFLRVRAGTVVRDHPVRLAREGSGHVMTWGAGFDEFVLAPGAAHDRMVVLVPERANRATFMMRRIGVGNVTFFVRPAPEGRVIGPDVPPAPPLSDPEWIKAPFEDGSGYRTLNLAGELPPGLWYMTPKNYGKDPVRIQITGGAGIDDDGPDYLQLQPGSYYNPARGGHGMFVYRAGGSIAILWYTYGRDGQPTWYYAQSDSPELGYLGTTIYRTAWLGEQQRRYPVGRLGIVPTSERSFHLAYVIDGESGIEHMEAFLTGCPTVGGAPLDASGHWFDPARSGTGYSVQVHPGYEFIAAYLYDRLGRPRFLVGERGGAFAAADDTMVLSQLRGFDPLGTYTAPVRTGVGILRRTYSPGGLATVDIDAEFDGGIDGTWQVADSVVPLGTPQGCVP